MSTDLTRSQKRRLAMQTPSKPASFKVVIHYKGKPSKPLEAAARNRWGEDTRDAVETAIDRAKANRPWRDWK